MSFFRNNGNSSISQTVLLALVVGFASGVVGQIVSDVYIDPFRDFFEQDVLLNNSGATTVPELKRIRQFLGIEQDFQVAEVVEQVQPSLARLLRADEVAGQATILTSDGWLMTMGTLTEAGIANTQVEYQGHLYPLQRFISDPSSQLQLIKIAADGLPVVTLGDSDDVNLGQLVVAISSEPSVVVTTVGSQLTLVNPDQLESSERFLRLTQVNADLTAYAGAPLVNLGGEVVGLVRSDGRVLPVNYTTSAILNILRTGAPRRVFFGVEYTQKLSATTGSSAGGALVKRVLPRSPAAQAGILTGDRILTIEGEPLTGEKSLIEAIQEYQPSDQLQLTLDRNGEALTVSVTLGLLEA
jgi:S1-C subfamily serine protease